MTDADLLLRGVMLEGRSADVLVAGGRVVRVGTDLTADARVVDAAGATLLPGLHDHHIHLLAAAAAAASVACGPPQVRTRDDLAAALAAVPGDGWVRAVGYDESVAGRLDRVALDALLADRPVRVQHRGGSLWSLNSAALGELGLAAAYPDGLLWRADEMLRPAAGGPPDLTALGARLASYGITGVTDATPGDASALAAASRAIPQRVLTLGTDPSGTLRHGAYKIVVPDHALPGLDELAGTIARAHADGRGAAVHSVTRESLLLTLLAFEQAGVLDGDRVEHAAVAPPEAIGLLARLGIVVVTQPSLVALRGDSYLERVDPDDVPYLWPYASLLAAGVRVGCSSDAPYGEADPWRSIAAATERRAPDGRVVGERERVDAATALGAYLTHPHDPGGVPRSVAVGAEADLVLVVPGPRGMIDAEVLLTVIGGRVGYAKEQA